MELSFISSLVIDVLRREASLGGNEFGRLWR